MRRLASSLWLGASVAACQPSVEGWWQGEVGDEPRTLRLEQTGSAIEGEICSREACEPLRGTIEERWLELGYGCSTCTMPETRLHLELVDLGLEGDATEVDCSCPAEPPCTCRPHARFVPCDGPC